MTSREPQTRTRRGHRAVLDGVTVEYERYGYVFTCACEPSRLRPLMGPCGFWYGLMEARAMMEVSLNMIVGHQAFESAIWPHLLEQLTAEGVL